MQFAHPQPLAGLSVILPAFNEEANLEKSVCQCLDIIPRLTSMDFEVVVVNDGSRDRTREILESLAALHPRVRPVHHSGNRGYGQAVLTGISNSRYELIFFTDADLQFDLTELREFLKRIPDYDMIVGYRLNRQDPWHRLVYAYIWNRVNRLLFGLKVRDADCAFKLFRRQVVDNTIMYSRGAMFSPEFLIQAVANGSRWTQLGVHHFPRVAGKPSGASLRVIARAGLELGKFFCRWYLSHNYYPVRQGQKMSNPTNLAVNPSAGEVEKRV